jgi:hypothetical protein
LGFQGGFEGSTQLSGHHRGEGGVEGLGWSLPSQDLAVAGVEAFLHSAQLVGVVDGSVKENVAVIALPKGCPVMIKDVGGV